MADQGAQTEAPWDLSAVYALFGRQIGVAIASARVNSKGEITLPKEYPRAIGRDATVPRSPVGSRKNRHIGGYGWRFFPFCDVGGSRISY